MSALQDPPRLFESSEAPAGLQALLEHAHHDVLSDGQVAAIAAAVARATSGASLAPLAVQGGSSQLLKWLSGALVLGLMGVATYRVVGEQATEAPPSEPMVEVQAVSPPEPDGVGTAPAETSEPELALKAPEPAALKAPVAATKQTPQSQLLEESRLLSQARSQLATNPGRALALTEQHRMKFPRGTLAQEREVIAIQALSKLGKGREAERRAGTFESKYPDSAHQERVKDSVGKQP